MSHDENKINECGYRIIIILYLNMCALSAFWIESSRIDLAGAIYFDAIHVWIQKNRCHECICENECPLYQCVHIPPTYISVDTPFVGKWRTLWGKVFHLLIAIFISSSLFGIVENPRRFNERTRFMHTLLQLRRM